MEDNYTEDNSNLKLSLLEKINVLLSIIIERKERLKGKTTVQRDKFTLNQKTSSEDINKILSDIDPINNLHSNTYTKNIGLKVNQPLYNRI